MKIKIILPALILLFFSCKKKEKTEEDKPPFDKQALLVNMADNVILPAYSDFKTSLDSLVLTYNTFKTSEQQSDFQIVKQKFHVACMRYQRISLFEFGPAENVIVRMNFNVFPTDTTQIKNNIAAGTYSLDAASNLDAKGLPALDYLFYGYMKTETDIVASFTTSVNRKQYVTDVLNDMSSKLNLIINDWNTSYKNTFINSLSTDVGSSIGFLVNQLNYELDYLKNSKVGIPLGKKSLGIPLPEKCEAFYGAQSLDYAYETLRIIEDVYTGKSTTGFDDYLIHLEAPYNGGLLNDAIIAQFNVAKAKLKAVPNPLSAQVTSNAAVVDAAYIELVKLLVLLKTDMPSSLGVIITYQDGDGD
ncbi:MAG: imelysin family protein [Bacteroidetes bacterium]|nr:imelysin family protein [Bacteroidota bacterium]